MHQFERHLDLPVPSEFLFAWHNRQGVFQRLTPPWEPVQLIAQKGHIEDGDWLKMRIGPIPWLAKHQGYIKNKQFCDIQVSGPFLDWQHRHLFESLNSDQSRLRDQISYRLPPHPGQFYTQTLVEKRLARMFAWRHRITATEVLAHYNWYQAREKGQENMRILISGASGFLGTQLRQFLETGGHEVWSLSRHSDGKPRSVTWNPDQGLLDAAHLEGFDGIIHLAGENIAAQPWSEQRKRNLRESRLKSTRLLTETVTKLQAKPQWVLSASAIGFYGDQGNTLLNEDSPAGNGFLAELCREWENATSDLDQVGVRVVHLRTGLVLSQAGGVLQKMQLPFQLGLGGKLGNGRQYMSWIALDDWLRAVLFLTQSSLSGPVNLVAPNAIRNLEFTQTLAQTLHRPAFFHVPRLGLEWAFGEMGEALFLGSQRVEPARLQSHGFVFQYPELSGALRHLFGR